jgi:hypothetical protein
MMNPSYKSPYLLLLMCLLGLPCRSQTAKPSFTLNGKETGTTRAYVARNFVSLQPGFNYAGASGTSFNAKTDPTLTFSISTIANPTPGDTSNTSEDKEYTPGNTSGSDPTQDLPGLTSITQKANGKSDTSYLFPVLWFKTVPLTNNLNGGYRWKDVTGNNATVRKYSSLGAGYGTEYVTTRDKVRTYNFNPAIDLSYETVRKEILVRNSNLPQATIIGVWGARADYDANKFLFALNGRKNESILLGKNMVVQADTAKTNLAFGSATTRNLLFQSNAIEGTDINLFHESSLRVGTYYKANRPDASVWGERQQAVITLGSKFDTTDVNNTSRFHAQWQGFDGFKGFTPEMLVFDRQLTELDCQKYESYLAIKYGISLDRSYVAADGRILWDYALNGAFKNRIAGYGRQDAVGLSQKMATTSYEELPYYSDLAAYDSNDSIDSYRLSSRSRLLVMGVQPGNAMEDGQYVLFGDNKGAVTPTDSLSQDYPHVMPRKWLVNTTYSSGQTDKDLTWQYTGNVQVTNPTTSEHNFLTKILKPVTGASASLVTSQPLKNKDGYFAWTVDIEYGPFFVKFGTNAAGLTQNAHDYGYSISADGQVYSIEKGLINSYSLFTVERGQRMEVEKNGNLLYLRVNGIRYKNTELEIDSAFADYAYYGALTFSSNSYELALLNFRHGGFVDTGHKVELSYLAQRASGLASYKNGNAYLIVDRSGDGQFTGTVDSYPCDELDATRSKIIFNNVFWDTDGNGKDAFTFGYKVPAVLRTAKSNAPDPEEEPASENGVNDVTVYYKSLTDQSTVTVKIQSDQPSPAIILVHDLLGRRIERRDLPESEEVHYADITLPKTGVYIVKVITNKKEYTQEVVSRR